MKGFELDSLNVRRSYLLASSTFEGFIYTPSTRTKIMIEIRDDAFVILGSMNNTTPNHAVKAVIRNGEGKILFLQRNPAKSSVANWDFPGGIVEAGEEDKVALRREIQEELGLDSIVMGELGRWSFYRPFDGKTVEVINYKVELADGVIKLSDEHIAFDWFDPTQIKDLPVKDSSIHHALGV